ncbi:MAG TPA: insulinase family protein, partial [Pyrinomonadaceae bacterium]|nr:insulinase family protein [Pyrinomonadaceae bacterium]
MKSIKLRRNLFVFALAAFVWAGSLASLAPASAAAAPQRAARQKPAQAQPKPTPEPAPSGPLAEAAPFVNKILPNGLEVIVLEDHSVPLVTVELAVRNGSFTETPELNGLSHLYEHMFFKVAPDQAIKNDYLRGIDSLGIVYNGETHEEVVNYYFTTTTPNFPVALRFMRDQAINQVFNEQQFAQEREVVVGELDRHESNPYGEIGEQMNRRLFYK